MLREVLARFGYEIDDATLARASKQIDAFKAKIGEAGKAFQLSKIDSWAKGIVSDMQGVAGEIRKVALQTGLTAQQVQQWAFAGVAPEALAKSVIHLQKEMVAAKDGTGEAAKTFKKLGVSVTDASGRLRPTGDVLSEVGTAIAGLPTEAERTAAAFAIFSRRGIDVLQVFNKGPAAIAAMNARFKELGGGLSDKAIAKLTLLGRAQKELKTATTTLKGELAGALAPGMTFVATKLADLAAWFGRVSERSNIVQVALIALGTIAVVQAIRMYGAYLPIIAAIVGIALVVEDLYTTFAGGPNADTLTNRAADAIGVFIMETLPDFFRFLGKDIEKVQMMIVGAFVIAINSTIEFVNSQVGAFLDAGTNLIMGIVNGIKSGAKAAVDAVTGVATDMKDAVKNAFGIHSPSTFMYDVGMNLDRGAIDGLLSGARGVDAAARQVFDPMSFAPRQTGGSVRTDARTSSAVVNNQIQVNVAASGSTAEDARRGVSQGLDDGNAALLEALEPVGG